MLVLESTSDLKEYQKESHEPLAIDTQLVTEIDDRLLIVMPCLQASQ